MNRTLLYALTVIFVFGVVTTVWGDTSGGDGQTIESNLKAGKDTDSTTIAKEEEAINLDGLSVAQMKELREKAEKFAFQAEVDRMMKLIINSLYRNKEIFLRELISNASDALDKIRFLSLTDTAALSATDELSIRIRANKEDKTLHIVDTGIGMTKEELMKNLGTIAKSGTSEFMAKLAEAQTQAESSDLIGQFGVGFYSSFLVADRVTVISKSNDDEQYIWESDANSFTITKDPRGNTLKRGTEVILHLKEDTQDYLEQESLKNLVVKYSQFINFPIYVWTTTKEMVDAEPETEAKEEDKTEEKKDEDATIEEEKENETAKPKQVEKEVTKWVLANENKPIWTRKPADVKDEEYNSFYKAFTKEYEDPLTKIHFVAEGEVTFKSILFIPKRAPHDMFRTMNTALDNIKLYVRRVFITDNFQDMMPSYLNFIKGVVDSDDLPLNVSRETLQQSKLLKVIKKKLVRKVLDMIKKLSDKDFDDFWKEFSTNIKLGVVEDNSNRTRLAKLVRFWSSHSDEKMTTLTDYVSRMKEKQKSIFFIAGESRDVLKKSPLVERVLKKGYEVLYLIDPIDEYAVNAIPDFDGKKFQNLAKEGLELAEDSEKVKEKKEALTKEFQSLIDYLAKEALKEYVEKVEISDRLSDSPCALVATQWGYSGNMERIMRAQAYKKSEDPQTAHLSQQKRILEINPRHPLIKELKARVSDDRKSEETTKNMATVLYETAVLRSGYALNDISSFASRVEHMMRLGLNVPLDEKAEEEEEEPAPEPSTEETTTSTPVKTEEAEDKEDEEDHTKTEL